MAYRTHAEELTHLASKISRLETAIERMELLGMATYSHAGITKNFIQYEVLLKQLARAKARYSQVQSIIAGAPMDPSVRYSYVSRL